MFDIHKVKPIHGWREFIGEVGIIVLGVLIALGAEQSLEAVHWRHQVEAGQEAVNDDLESVAGQAIEREAGSACLGRRLNELATIIDRASVTGRLPPIGPIGNPPQRLWHLQAWDTLVAAQTATHFKKDDLISLNDLDAYLKTVEQLNAEEFNHWTTLWTIVGPGRKLAIGEETELRSALSHAGYDAKLMRVNVNQIFRHIAEGGLLSRAELDEVRKRASAELVKRLRKGAACQPLGIAPPGYGHSPFTLDLQAPFPID